MLFSDQWRALESTRAARMVLLSLGALLLLVTPLFGMMPGPGGIVTFAAGAALVLRYSPWAKRQYARWKRRHPKLFSWSDWALRRRSYKRREERGKRETGRALAESARRSEVGRVERGDGLAQLVMVRHQVGVIGYFIERRFDPDGGEMQESYWAVIRFSGLFETLEAARADGLRALEQA